MRRIKIRNIINYGIMYFLILTLLWVNIPYYYSNYTERKFFNKSKTEDTMNNDEINYLYELTSELLTKSEKWHKTENLLKRTKDCDVYFNKFPALIASNGFINYEKTQFIEQFSIAFSHVVHKDIAILEVFLALYFRPNNFHCIHVDKKAGDEIRKAVEGLVRCYSLKKGTGEIFVFDKAESLSIDWASSELLKADLMCINKLLNFANDGKPSWQYILPVAGTELPIIPYHDFHNTLSKSLRNNKSAVDSLILPERNKNRLSSEQVPFIKGRPKMNQPILFELKNPIAPYNIPFKVFKGIRYVILSSKDALFIAKHPVARAFYDFFQLGNFPEEHFYSTVIRIKTDKEGLYYQNWNDDTENGVCLRYLIWGCDECYGKCFNYVCNFNSMDLKKVWSNTHCIIANKFNLNIDSTAVMQQFIYVLQSTNWYDKRWKKLFLKLRIQNIKSKQQ